MHVLHFNSFILYVVLFSSTFYPPSKTEYIHLFQRQGVHGNVHMTYIDDCLKQHNTYITGVKCIILTQASQFSIWS